MKFSKKLLVSVAAMTCWSQTHSMAADYLVKMPESPPTNCGPQYKAKVNTYQSGGQLGMTLADMNGDGKLDVIGTENGPNTTLLLGNGHGSFALTNLIGPGAIGSAVGDFNNDGKPDVVISGPGSMVQIALNTSKKHVLSFGPWVSYPAGVAPVSIGVADFNHDGNMDLAISDTQDLVSVLLGNGDGTFQPQQQYPMTDYTNSLVVADVNGDGHADIIGGETFSNTVEVLLNNGDGTFAPGVTYPVGTLPAAVAVTKWGSQIAIATANLNDDTVTVLTAKKFDGSQHYTRQDFSVGTNPESVVLTDINNDGVPDLVVGNTNPSSLSIFIGNRNMNPLFSCMTTLSAPINPISLAAGSLRNDGKIDIIAGDENPDNNVAVFLHK